MNDRDLAGIVTAGSSAAISGEQLISLTDAAQETPRRPTVRTVWRWTSHGVAGVRLETFKVGGRTYTSREALARFLAALNDQPAPQVELQRIEQERADHE